MHNLDWSSPATSEVLLTVGQVFVCWDLDCLQIENQLYSRTGSVFDRSIKEGPAGLGGPWRVQWPIVTRRTNGALLEDKFAFSDSWCDDYQRRRRRRRWQHGFWCYKEDANLLGLTRIYGIHWYSTEIGIFFLHLKSWHREDPIVFRKDFIGMNDGVFIYGGRCYMNISSINQKNVL